MKFIGNLGKFEDLQSNDSPYEFHSKMNDNEASIPTIGRLPDPDDAFDHPEDDGDDIPF
jgi:replicative DNA helicase